jgi:hypothetical protein
VNCQKADDGLTGIFVYLTGSWVFKNWFLKKFFKKQFAIARFISTYTNIPVNRREAWRIPARPA